MNRTLDTISKEEQGLGRDTIMNPWMAANFGSEYVHLAAFAIDVDRIQEAVEEDPMAKWPDGWEVFLTEYYLLGLLEPMSDEYLFLLRKACEEIVGDQEAGMLLGAQLPFAVYDASARGFLPEGLKSVFSQWESVELPEELNEFWNAPNIEAADLAEACLEIELHPPLSPTTRVALEDIMAANDADKPSSENLEDTPES